MNGFMIEPFCSEILTDRLFPQFAEQSGYWLSTSFLSEVTAGGPPSSDSPVIFYDSNTGKELYKAPIGRSWEDFVAESKRHGWPR